MRLIEDNGAYAFNDTEKVAAAWELLHARSELGPAIDHGLMTRLLIWLFDKGIEDPQKLEDVSFLLASSKLFTSMF